MLSLMASIPLETVPELSDPHASATTTTSSSSTNHDHARLTTTTATNQRRPSIQIIGNYKLGKKLGEGNFAKVRLARHTLTDVEVAVKIIDKTNLSETNLAKLAREVNIMKRLSHPNIVKLYEVIDTEKALYLVMEYANGGEVFDYLVAHGRMKEKEARAKFRDIVSAVNYCHQMGIIHRDLKAENLLLDAEMNIKIADFGFSNHFTPGNQLNTFCGSPPYAAPELFQGKTYEGPEVDVWSLGVILYTLVSGSLPFDGTNLKELRERVLKGRYRIPFYMTTECEQLLKMFLVINPAKRTSLAAIMSHPWLNIGYENDVLKPYQEPAFDFNDDIRLTQMEEWGFARDEVIHSLQTYQFDQRTGCYLLLPKRKVSSHKISQPQSSAPRVTRSQTSTGLPIADNRPKPPTTAPFVPPPSSLIQTPPSQHQGNLTTHKNSPSMPRAAPVPIPAEPIPSLPSTPTPRLSSEGSPKSPPALPNAPTTPSSLRKGSSPPTHNGGSHTFFVNTPPASPMTPSTPVQVVSVNPLHNGNGVHNGHHAHPNGTMSPTRSMSPGPRPFSRRHSSVLPSLVPGSPDKAAPPPLSRDMDLISNSSHMSPFADEPQTPTRMTRSSATSQSVRVPRRRTATESDTPPSPSPDDQPKGFFDTIKRRLSRRSRTFSSTGAPVAELPPSRPTTPSPLAPAGKPRSLRFTFGMANTSDKPADTILENIKATLRQNGVEYSLTEAYLLTCLLGEVQFEMEVCKLPRLSTNGIRHKRICGNSLVYKDLCQKILSQLALK